MSQDDQIKEKNIEFIALFKFETDAKYFEPVPFDKEFGFSIKRKHDEEVIRHLPEDFDIDDGYEYFALFHIFIEAEEFHKMQNRKSLGIRTTNVLHKERLMIVEPQNIHWPVDIISKDEYSFDTEIQKFFRGDSPIKPLVMLEEMYKVHSMPSRAFRGMWFRRKKDSLIFLSSLTIFITQILILIGKFLFGIKYTWNFDKRYAEVRYPQLFENTFSGVTKKEDKVEEQSNEVEFLGFRAKRWALFLYCIFHLIVYFVFPDLKEIVQLRRLFTNTFLSLLYVFVTLTFYDRYLPQILRLLISQLTILSGWIKDRPIKVS